LSKNQPHSATGFPAIETRRLLLIMLQPEDAGRMARYVDENRTHLAAWEPSRADEYYQMDFWTDEIATINDEFRAGRMVRVALVAKADPMGRILGQCSFSNIVRAAFQACHLGYALDYRDIGKGLMFEALTAFIDYAFRELRLHRIQANYMPANERSGGLLKRLDFVVEGYARDYLFLAGKWQDHILTSKTNPSWQPT
jgi:[ribosomal protein S5]-alanine N-acetyltransferase